MPRHSILLTPANESQLEEWRIRLKQAGYLAVEKVWDVVGERPNLFIPPQWGKVPPLEIALKGDSNDKEEAESRKDLN